MHRLAATTTTELERASLGARSLVGAPNLASPCLAFAASASHSAPATESLRISPVIVEVPAGDSVSTVNLGNQDSRPVSVQVRPFRWSQADGQETLTPTRDVVASPPIATIEPHASLDARVIRLAETEIAAEESYRLIVDQSPQLDDEWRSLASFPPRQALPVFFEPSERRSPEVARSVHRTRRGHTLQARNSRDRRLRISKVPRSGDAAFVTVTGGLAGYSLDHSEISWSFFPRRGGFPVGTRVTPRGDGDAGSLRAFAPVSAGQ